MKKVDLFYVILSVVIPIVGFFLFIKEKLDGNDKGVATSYLLAAIGGVVIQFIILFNL